MSQHQLSEFTIERIQSGQAILFLGAGTAFGAIEGGKSKPLSGNALRDSISDKFLGGDLKDRSLSQVAEIAKSEAGLFFVQEFIKELLKDLKPAAFHLLMPSFRWKAIVTTNYDFVIERAYRDSDVKRQRLSTLLGDDDNFSDVTRDLDSVPFLKLHGCLSRIRDKNFPLILASEEYARHKKNRTTLFRLFSDLTRQYPTIFCGYDLSDQNITQILYDIGDDSISRPRHIIVKPSFSDYDLRYYSSRRIDPFVSTFQDFLSYLDDTIPEQKRTLGALIKNDSVLSMWIQADAGVESEGLSYYLANELQYVNIELSSEVVSPADFYNGLASPWGVFSEGYDCARNISDTIALEALLEQELESNSKLFLLLGHAGSGKSIVLRRLAWDAATKYSRLAFFLREGGSLKREYIEEIWQLTKEPFILFVESSISHIVDVERLIRYFQKFKIPATFIIEARSNEWNVAGEKLDNIVSKSYEVVDMTRKEIGSLLEKLEEFDCLGALGEVSREQRLDHVRVSAEKQLLVALLEATQGKSLEEIVLDEYKNITPIEARVLYLDVCTLHRFGVSVRAGLISRISNISFSYFASKLLLPLEHVVRTFVDSYSRDNAYRSRHQEIARIVFDYVLDTPERKVDQIVRLISSMNIDYQSDRQAFDQMIKGHLVAEAFADKSLGGKVYAAAYQCGANESYITHQQAVFELNHLNGDYNKALSLINSALQKAEYGQKAIKHTKALVLRRLAQDANEGLQKDKYRTEAKFLLQNQLKLKDSAYAYSALLNILIDELAERLSDNDSSLASAEANDRVSEELIAEIEDFLYRGGQDNPGDDVLLSIESKYANLIGETPRAARQIEAAYKKNPNSTYTALSLAKLKEGSLGFEAALKILSDSIERNPSSKQLHLNIAKLCIRNKENEYIQFIDTNLRKAFSDGDSNYEAQFWYARQNYLYGDVNKARKIYLAIRNSKLPNTFKDKKRGVVCNSEGQKTTYYGLVARRTESFCFVNCPEFGEDIFIHYSAFGDKEWDKVVPGVKVSFELGFRLRGPVGVRAWLSE